MNSIDDIRKSAADRVRREYAQRGIPSEHAENTASTIMSGAMDAQLRRDYTTMGMMSPSTTSIAEDAQRANENAFDTMTKQQKDRIKLLKSMRGNPRKSQDPRSILAMQPNPKIPDPPRDGRVVCFFVIPEPNPPCNTALADLEPVVLSHLRLETRHRGKVLLAKLTGRYNVGLSGWLSAVEDTTGTLELIKIPAFCMTYDGQWSQQGAWVAIKDPCLTLDEGMNQCLKLEHASDLVFLERMPRDFRPSSPMFGNVFPESYDPLKCKESGNAFLKSGSLVKAHASYSEGLDQLRTDESDVNATLLRDLHRNRALINLSFRRFDEALTDAVAALHGSADGSQNARAYSRAGRAAYSLRRFGEAQDFFQKQLELLMIDDKDRPDCQKRLENAKSRLQEEKTGRYDLQQLRRSLSAQHPRADIADFVNNVEARESSLGGRGLFATKDIAFGELVLIEKAFCAIWHFEDAALTAFKYYEQYPDLGPTAGMLGVWRQTYAYARNNPSEAAMLLDLHGDYKGIGKDPVVVDGVPVIDSYQVHDIVARNSFGLEDAWGNTEAGQFSSGIWVKASYINHSCLPNTVRAFAGDVIAVYAARNIRKGDELTIIYGDPDNHEGRTRNMQNTWHFTCSCALCKAEGTDTAETRGERKKLAQQAKAFLNKYPPVSGSDNTFTPAVRSKGEKILEDLLATYDKQRFAGLPRIAAWELSLWLVETMASVAATGGTSHANFHARVATHFELYGYAVTLRSGKVVGVQPTAYSYLPADCYSKLVMPLIHVAHITRDSGVKEKILKTAKAMMMALEQSTVAVDRAMYG